MHGHLVTVHHWNGYTIHYGLITGGDFNGLYVLPGGNGSTPVYCDFSNVKSIEFHK